MPQGTAPPEEGTPEVTDLPRGVDADAVVVHDDPVRIPFTALPPRPVLPPRGSDFSSTFVIGVNTAPWIAAAFIVGGEFAGMLALGWSTLLAANLAVVLLRR